MTPQFWMNLQSRYDLEVAEDNLAGKLEKEVHVYQAAQAA
jgi:plasmid maintenance system antidote protein VapI